VLICNLAQQASSRPSGDCITESRILRFESEIFSKAATVKKNVIYSRSLEGATVGR
jgi:hypothetical protein